MNSANINTNDACNRKHIAVVTMGVKLGDETKGYTRFRYLSELLVKEGFTVDLITSSFQHWEKEHRDCSHSSYQGLPYRVIFIDEPGYKKNLDVARIRSHAKAAKNLQAYFKTSGITYNLIYAEIPPNDVARTCAEFAYTQSIPFVADINDLWPEAMRMVMNIPLVNNIVYYPFTRDARQVYKLLTGAVGTSAEYTMRPSKDRLDPYEKATVYVGNDLSDFDAGVKKHHAEIKKPKDELWVAYAGTLGTSYDIATFIESASLVEKSSALRKKGIAVRFKILGDGPDRKALERLAQNVEAPVDFLGYLDYHRMAAYLSASDITVNSLIKNAAQSIVTKIGDYLASNSAMINTGSSLEFQTKVVEGGFGLNIEAEDAQKLAEAVLELALDEQKRNDMGTKGRMIAETEFDQPQAYRRIVDLIESLVGDLD